MDEVLYLVNEYVVDPYILRVEPASQTFSPLGSWSEDYSTLRVFMVMWIFTYISSMIIYIVFSSLTFFLFYVEGGKIEDGQNPAHWRLNKAGREQIKLEVWVSTWSLFVMSGLTSVMEMLILMGYGKVYDSISDYGVGYLLLSPVLFLIFTDFWIYWIHRWLHWGILYKLHKLHHLWKETTPYSAFAFNPFDGFAQSFPYHVFVMFFPMHKRLYLIVLFLVGLWTVNIHDRVTFRIPGVNGAAHHTIHHTKFNYNYGQYFTFWDHVFGTYKDPLQYFPYNIKDKEGVAEFEQEGITQKKKEL